MGKTDKTVIFDTVYVFESLYPQNTKTGKNLYDDILKPFEDDIPDFQCYYYDINNRNEFFQHLEYVKSDVYTSNRFPIIHFEIHGSEDFKGFGLKNGDFIKWEDIYPIFMEINTRINNNLLITLAVCYGASLMKVILPDDRSPFWGIVGNFDEIYEDELELGYRGFYEKIILEHNLNEAVDLLNEENLNGKLDYKLINSEETFKRVFDNYLKEICSAQNLDSRAEVMYKKSLTITGGNEKLLIKLFKNKYGNKINNKNRLKKFFKKLIYEKQPNIFKKYKSYFFMYDLYPDNKKTYLKGYNPDFYSVKKNI